MFLELISKESPDISIYISFFSSKMIWTWRMFFVLVDFLQPHKEGQPQLP